MPADVLDWLHAHGEMQDYPGGTETMTPGAPIDYLLAVLRGGIQYFAGQNGQREPKFRATVGEITGLLPHSRLQSGKGYGVTLGDTTLYCLHRTSLPPWKP